MNLQYSIHKRELKNRMARYDAWTCKNAIAERNRAYAKKRKRTGTREEYARKRRRHYKALMRAIRVLESVRLFNVTPPDRKAWDQVIHELRAKALRIETKFPSD